MPKVNPQLRKFLYANRSKMTQPPKLKRKKKRLALKKKPVKVSFTFDNSKRSTSFKDAVNPNKYSFEVRDKWVYKDKNFPKIENAIIPSISKLDHLILKDSKGRPRFVLGYKKNQTGTLLVHDIQRERTQYKFERNGMKWRSDLETIESKKFQQELGMHPSEFLLSELLYRNADLIKTEILKGNVGLVFYLHKGVSIPEELGGGNLSKPLEKIYRPLIERFFKTKPIILADTHFYELNPNKKRVQQILGIKVTKKTA